MPEKFEEGEIYPWSMVALLHRSRNGIYQKNGRLISLLTDFGRINPCYPDIHGAGNAIFYTGSGRRGDQKLDAANRSLLDAADRGQAVPLFNKLRVNSWEFLGYWQILSGEYVFDDVRERMVWKFKLKKDARGELPTDKM